MTITFNTQNENEVAEVVQYLENIGMVRANETEHVTRVTETAQKPTEKEIPTPSIPEEKKAVEPVKKTRAKKVTLDDLKELAKKKVETSSREEVKAIIGEYSDKLSDVKESDYAELAVKLA